MHEIGIVEERAVGEVVGGKGAVVVVELWVGRPMTWFICEEGGVSVQLGAKGTGGW